MPDRDPEIQRLLGMVNTSEMSRRQLLKRSAALGLAVPAVSALLAACGGEEDEGDGGDDSGDTGAGSGDTDDEATEEEGDASGDDESAEETPDSGDDDAGADEGSSGEGQRGGTLEVALIGEPPTLDIHQTTATIVALITWHIYEPLFTWDGEFQLANELAESHEVSEDGLTNTITIRQGVPFHNGDELTANDVVASIERWAGISGLGESLLANVDSIEVVDDYTIDFQMTDPYGAFAVVLARQNQGCAIYPASVIEASDETGLSENIGTGPYQFVEHVPDQYIHLQRFEDYSSREEEPSGYAGKKNQYLDEMYLRPVPDEASRIAGLQAGDFHYLESIIPDHYDSLKDDENVTVEILGTSGWGVFVMNTAEGLLTDQTLRKAVQAAIDCEPVLQAGFGEGFFDMNPGIMTGDTAWSSDVGAEFYSMGDPDRAAELLEEAGYDGTPIRLMTTQEYQHHYNQAVVVEQQLTDAGFTVEVETFDWATVGERRSDPALWDIFTTSFSFRVDPVQLPMLQGTTWPGWWDSEEKIELTTQLERETGFENRYAVMEQIQELFYEEAPQIKTGDSLELNARSPVVQNFTTPTQLQPSFWNVWLEEA